jgi:hypothetical protein
MARLGPIAPAGGGTMRLDVTRKRDMSYHHFATAAATAA